MTTPLDDTYKSVDEILIERGKIYGRYADVAQLSQNLKRQLEIGCNPGVVQRESLDMICNKMARIANGAGSHIDSWKDIAGYAQLVVDYLLDLQERNK